MPTQPSSSATARSPSSTFPGSSRSWTASRPARASSRSASSRPRSRSSQLPQRRRAAATSSSPARALTDGHLLVAHTNDLYAEDEDDVVAVEWRVPGEPVVFTLGIGPWISVGWNDAGLSVTGNELTPNDERVGIPRLLQMRDALTRRTLADAVEAVLHPARASSYNWVFAHPAEGVLNVEGSADELRRRPPRRRRDPRAHEPLRQRGHAEVRELRPRRRLVPPPRARPRARAGRAVHGRHASRRPSPTTRTRQTPSAGTATPPRT